MQLKHVALNNRLENRRSFYVIHRMKFLRKKVFVEFELNIYTKVNLEWLRTEIKFQTHGLENGRKVIKQ